VTLRREEVVVLTAWLACACAESGPEVTSTRPSNGPYGTVVTVEGSGLGGELGRIEFENGVTLPHSSVLVRSWSDSRIVFRMPAPAAGRFRIVPFAPRGEPELSVHAGRFDPAPWRPRLLSVLDDVRTSVDWVPLGEEWVVEAVRTGGALELRFFGADAEPLVRTVNVDASTVRLVATGADSVAGFFFDTREGVVFGSFTATVEGTEEVVMGAPPATADSLVAVDSDENGSYAWLSDGTQGLLSKWQLVDTSLTEVLTVPDPADRSSGGQRMSVRGEHSWRVWATNGLDFDSEYTVFAAYLAPDATEFAPAENLGSGDDYVSMLTAHGVSLNGEVAVDACGNRDGVLEGAYESCVSAAASPNGVIESNEGEIDEARTFYTAFDTGIAALDCDDHVRVLRHLSSDETEPLLTPCGSMLRAHRHDPAGIPSFDYSVPGLDSLSGRTYVLSKY
jgi:hypothetical protein